MSLHNKRLYLSLIFFILIICTSSPANSSFSETQIKVPPAPLPIPQIEAWSDLVSNMHYRITFQTTAGQCVKNISLYQNGVRIGIWFNDLLVQQLVFTGAFSVNSFSFLIANFSIEVFQWRTGEFGEPIWRIDHGDISVFSPTYAWIIVAGAAGAFLAVFLILRMRRKSLIIEFTK